MHQALDLRASVWFVLCSFSYNDILHHRPGIPLKTLTSWIHQSVRAGAVSQGLKIMQGLQVAPLLAVHQCRALHQVHQAGHLRTSRASSPWPSSSISTTTSTNTRTRTNTSRPSCTPQLPHRLWWDTLCCCVEHLCCTSSVSGMCTVFIFIYFFFFFFRFNPHTAFVFQFDKYAGKIDGLYRHPVSILCQVTYYIVDDS